MFIILLIHFIIYILLCDANIPSSIRQPTLFTQAKFTIEKTIIKLWKGTQKLVTNFQEAERIKKFKKKHGEKLLTFSQYKFLEQSKDDFSKLFRLGITLPISPSLFFYSYIVFPMISFSNPWAWQALPSSYDDEDDKLTRQKIIQGRRTRAIFKAVTILEQDAAENGNTETQNNRMKTIEYLIKSLNSKSLSESMSCLQPWFQTDSKNSGKLVLNLSLFPGSIINDCCKSLGIDALPNLPLIRRFSIGQLSSYLDKVNIF
jgi:hypothetical protein